MSIDPALYDPLTRSLIATLLAALAYFIPSLIARVRHHHNTMAIITLNLLLGWTVVGWIGALIWSLTRPPKG